MTDPDQAAPVDLDAARLQLDVAVAQLVRPSTEQITRADGILDDHVAAQRAEERETQRELQQRIATHRAAGQDPQARLVMRQLRDHRRRVVARRTSAAVTSDAAAVPSLLHQLRDAVQSSSSTGGAASAGAHRSPIGLAAAELLATIERRVGRGPLTELVREWASHVTSWSMQPEHDPQVLLTAAHEAEQWVATGRAILNPQRRLTAVGSCPVCGRSTAHVRDDTGEIVRRPALELNPNDGSARCIVTGCAGYWPADRIQLLASVLEEQAQDKAG